MFTTEGSISINMSSNTERDNRTKWSLMKELNDKCFAILSERFRIRH